MHGYRLKAPCWPKQVGPDTTMCLLAVAGACSAPPSLLLPPTPHPLPLTWISLVPALSSLSSSLFLCCVSLCGLRAAAAAASHRGHAHIYIAAGAAPPPRTPPNQPNPPLPPRPTNSLHPAKAAPRKDAAARTVRGSKRAREVVERRRARRHNRAGMGGKRQRQVGTGLPPGQATTLQQGWRSSATQLCTRHSRKSKSC